MALGALRSAGSRAVDAGAMMRMYAREIVGLAPSKLPPSIRSLIHPQTPRQSLCTGTRVIGFSSTPPNAVPFLSASVAPHKHRARAPNLHHPSSPALARVCTAPAVGA